MMVVVFSTFFSSFAGGLIIVVSFSVTFSAGAVLTRESQAARSPKAAAITMMGFIRGTSEGVRRRAPPVTESAPVNTRGELLAGLRGRGGGLLFHDGRNEGND